jgi:hypothetical protein
MKTKSLCIAFVLSLLLLSVVNHAEADDLTFWQGTLETGPPPVSEDAALANFIFMSFSFYAIDSFESPVTDPSFSRGPYIIDSGPFALTTFVPTGFHVDSLNYGPSAAFALITAPDGYQFGAGGVAIFGPDHNSTQWSYILVSGVNNLGGGSVTITDLGPAPEPSSLLLFSLGLVVLGFILKFRIPSLRD